MTINVDFGDFFLRQLSDMNRQKVYYDLLLFETFSDKF